MVEGAVPISVASKLTECLGHRHRVSALADVPVRAAKILQTGLEDGLIESNERNWIRYVTFVQSRDEELAAALAR